MAYFIFILTIPIVLATLVRIKLHLKTAQFFSTETSQSVRSFPPISILVPVRGLDHGAESNYLSLIQQDYPAPFEVIFALESETDPAVSLIKTLIVQHSDQTIRSVISDGLPGIGKIQNQIAATRACKYDLWILIDSDVRLPSDFLKSQAAWLAEAPSIGLAYAPPIAIGAQNWVAALHNMDVSASLMNNCHAAVEHKLNAAVGSCIVTRRDVIEKMGGLESLSHRVVGLDISLGKAVFQENYEIRLLQQPAQIHHERDTFGHYWWQIHRWLTTFNHYSPHFWLVGLILGVPVGWALLFLLLALVIGHFQTVGICLILFTALFEILSASIIILSISKDHSLWKYLWLAPLRQIIILPLLLMSRTSQQVKWRGRWLSLDTPTP